ncbi:putative phosphoribosyl transferase [Luteibacter jiangsuensis]|uniref:Phosphoribosyl transferase n=1 Tax=Luteibacter jiangsuensis TaxID=637577 RepID=A0ABT9STJ5_9GAMM|nr:alpha/beta family hydrolase [Luteibacter jiangsuensis]MDQ0008311.1 putative phosphoribosyl transferase [Luteibacter jiangsuensis]
MAPATDTVFRDRRDAGERLASALAPLRGTRPLVLGIPRGGLAVARVVADQIDGELDAVLVRKLGAPGHEEYAIGAIDESGRYEVSPHAAASGANEAYVRQEAARQLERLVQRRRLYSPHRNPHDPAGRVVVVVDDGLATGATMRSALRAVRRQNPARLVAAVPVAAPDSLASIRALADDIVCLSVPAAFHSVGEYYLSFNPVEDDEVIRLLARDEVAEASDRHAVPMVFDVDDTMLEGDLHVPPRASGIVVFVHGSGSSRRSSRNRYVASALQARGFATLLFDLLSADEERATSERFDIDKLARRLDAVLSRVSEEPELASLPLALFGASTGAAAALVVAARRHDIRAVVSRGGRPDLAGRDALAKVTAPTLLIVGSADREVIALNRAALGEMSTTAELVLVPGATHLFEEVGALEQVASLAGDWFARWW